MTLLWIIVFCTLGGILSVLAASLFLLLREPLRVQAMPHLISFATGALLGAAFLALLPHAIEAYGDGDVHEITLTVLLGVMFFFLLEKLVIWRHCHSGYCEVHVPEDQHRHHASGTMVLIGDAMHNLVDGVLIAAAFLTDFHLGVVVSLAVAAHEIPQEVGDFIILLHSGFSRMRAFLFNILSSLTTIIGGVAAYYSMKDIMHVLPYVLAVAAASFIYVAVADLIPTLHKRTQLKATLQQVVLIIAGVSLIYIAHSTMHGAG
ncbi:MAG: ZIP zinc transporter [Gammaproteobacteria bacterium RBG_16_57_12]|nr:MAG: ZIP zinc transporter [Gammaproteobacteria bacterium RBG_16_57_12]